MNFIFIAVSCLAALFLAMYIALELGRWSILRRAVSGAEIVPRGVNTVEAAVFGLLGLLIAFTFSGAESRFQIRRQLIAQESNAIGTAYLRISVLPPKTQPPIREAFRRYIDTRVAYFRAGTDNPQTREELAKTTQALQQDIWDSSVHACQLDPRTTACILMLPALNDMIDITSTRAMAGQIHPPNVIYALLSAVALICAFLAGAGMAASKSRSWSHILAFAIIMAITLYVIVDLEYPRAGLIRVTSEDAFLAAVAQMMR